MNNKIIDIVHSNEWEVLTDDGWQDFLGVTKTKKFKKYKLVTENGKSIVAADKHLIFEQNGFPIHLKKLKEKDLVYTKDGLEQIKSITNLHEKEHMYDLFEVDNWKYFTNDFLSHNTTVYTIYLTWYMLFHKHKNVAILANKERVAIDILKRVKKAYALLPFWLQKGVTKWKEREIGLENGSRCGAYPTTNDGIRMSSVNILIIDECVSGETRITIQNKETDQIEEITIVELEKRLISEFIKNKLLQKTKDKVNSNAKKILNKFNDEYEYILNSVGDTFVEKLYLLYHMIPPKKCIVCGKKATFLQFPTGYGKTCGEQRCVSVASANTQRGRKNPKHAEWLKKYGSFKDPKVREKINKKLRIVTRTKEYREKIGAISRQRYANPELRLKQSNIMKEKIKNGEFTPNITNSWTRWSININGKKFRSSFEGIFHLYHNIFQHKNFEYEKIRIPYHHTELNKERIYIVDFVDKENKVLFEIKPTSLVEKQINIDKFNAMEIWCKENKYSYQIIDEKTIFKYYLIMIEANFNHEFLNEFKKRYFNEIKKLKI